MRNGMRYLAVALFALCSPALAETALGEINIQLYGNIVDFTCVAEGTTAIKPSRSAPGPRNSFAQRGAGRSLYRSP